MDGNARYVWCTVWREIIWCGFVKKEKNFSIKSICFRSDTNGFGFSKRVEQKWASVVWKTINRGGRKNIKYHFDGNIVVDSIPVEYSMLFAYDVKRSPRTKLQAGVLRSGLPGRDSRPARREEGFQDGIPGQRVQKTEPRTGGKFHFFNFSYFFYMYNFFRFLYN